MLTFRPISTDRKTKIWVVSSKGITLGDVKWFPQWRRYCFFPSPQTLFDHTCLTEISGFCYTETQQHKEDLKNG